MLPLITVDVKPALAVLRNAERQWPFVQANTVNSLAFRARTRLQKQMDDVFNIRRRGLLRQIKVQKARRNDNSSRVFVPQWFWYTQEHGGVRTPRSSENLKVPINEKARRVRVRQGSTFVIDKGRRKFLARRKGRRGSKQVDVIATLRKRVKHQPVFRFENTVRDVVFSFANLEFRKSFNFANGRR